MVSSPPSGPPGIATFWASRDVRFHRPGPKDIQYPAVDDLHIRFEVMDLPADPVCLSLIVFSAEPGSTSEDGLRLLATWAATTDQQTETTSPPATLT